METIYITEDLPDRKINELWCWVAVDPKTYLEGICAVMISGIPFQAVSSSYETSMKMKPILLQMKKETGMNFKLVKFSYESQADSVT